MTPLRHPINARGWKHWTSVLALTALGTFLGYHASEAGLLIDLRYRLHQYMTNLNPRPLDIRHTAVVLIGDEEYWRGELAHRRPIKRDYLARLLLAVDGANPTLIALDFDLSAPEPSYPTIRPDYHRETRELVEAIRRIATRRPLVLPQTVGGGSGGYVLEADVYDHWHLCPRSPQEKQGPNIFCGYIALPNDMRLLPPRLLLSNGLYLDSFAAAAARARRPFAPAGEQSIALGYGSFIPYERYKSQLAVVTAGDVFTRVEERRKLEHRVVLIGSGWSRLAYGRGGLADGHSSPVGVIPGVFVHANYVEAILDGRAYRPIPEWVGISAEVLVVLAAALVFAARLPPWRKAGAIAFLCICLGLFSYLLFQNLGRFFDAFIPLLMVAGHAVFEQVRRWREEAHRARVVHHVSEEHR